MIKVFGCELPHLQLVLQGCIDDPPLLSRNGQRSRSFLASMVEPMLEKFDRYWSDYNLSLSCVAILDPRFKIKFVEYCLDKIRVEKVLTTLRSLYNDYKLQSSTCPIVAPPSSSSSGFGHFYLFDDYQSYKPKNNRIQTGKSQLDF